MCQQCCYFENEERGPLLFEDEVTRIKTLAGQRGVEVRFREVVVNGVRMYRWLIRGYCPFYDRNTGLCTIHPMKPLACKMYPLLYNPNTGEVLISTECQWVKQQMEKGHTPTLDEFPQETRALEEALSKLLRINIKIEIEK